MRISDWSSDVCSSDLGHDRLRTPDAAWLARGAYMVGGRMTAKAAPAQADSPALRPFRLIGRTVLAAFREVGRISVFSARVMAACVTPITDARRVGKELSVSVDLGGRRLNKKKK